MAALDEHTRHVGLRQRSEAHAPAARLNRRQQRVRIGRHKDEDRGWRRLFERLEQRVLRLRCHGVRWIDDEDAAGRLEWTVSNHVEHALAQDLDLERGRVTPIDFSDVRMLTARDAHACRTRAARIRSGCGAFEFESIRTIDRLRQCDGHRVFADAGGSRKNQTGRHTLAANGFAQQIEDETMAENRRERHYFTNKYVITPGTSSVDCWR